MILLSLFYHNLCTIQFLYCYNYLSYIVREFRDMNTLVSYIVREIVHCERKSYRLMSEWNWKYARPRSGMGQNQRQIVGELRHLDFIKRFCWTENFYLANFKIMFSDNIFIQDCIMFFTWRRRSKFKLREDFYTYHLLVSAFLNN